MAGKITIPEHVVAQAKALREAGLSWPKIGEALGYKKNTLRIRADQEFRSKQQAQKKASNKAFLNMIRRSNGAYLSHVDRGRLTDNELKARRALIPLDTRDLTAKLCGDPIPGDRRRSA
jgi:hypothetical protein